ncbi:MAG: hypothetical protein ACLKAO_13015, partial [Alkaliphilus sp.]
MDMAIIEYSKQLKLGTIAKEWDSIEYVNKKQYIHDLLLHEIKEREINRINRAVKSAGFKIMKTLSDFQWSTNIDIPRCIFFLMLLFLLFYCICQAKSKVVLPTNSLFRAKNFLIGKSLYFVTIYNQPCRTFHVLFSLACQHYLLQ